MKGGFLQNKIKLGTEVEKLHKEKHVFPELVFIIHLIFLCEPKQCTAVYVQFQSIMNGMFSSASLLQTAQQKTSKTVQR